MYHDGSQDNGHIVFYITNLIWIIIVYFEPCNHIILQGYCV